MQTNTQQASSPAPAMMPYPVPRSKTVVDIQDVLQVLRNEGASSEMILAVKELELYS